VVSGHLPNRWWEEADFCARELNGIATPAECDKLKRVAAATPLPMPPEAQDWIDRDKKLSLDPLLDWVGLVPVPPIAILLITVALAWALRGFRRG